MLNSHEKFCFRKCVFNSELYNKVNVKTIKFVYNLFRKTIIQDILIQNWT